MSHFLSGVAERLGVEEKDLLMRRSVQYYDIIAQALPFPAIIIRNIRHRPVILKSLKFLSKHWTVDKMFRRCLEKIPTG